MSTRRSARLSGIQPTLASPDVELVKSRKRMKTVLESRPAIICPKIAKAPSVLGQEPEQKTTATPYKQKPQVTPEKKAKISPKKNAEISPEKEAKISPAKKAQAVDGAASHVDEANQKPQVTAGDLAEANPDGVKQVAGAAANVVASDEKAQAVATDVPRIVNDQKFKVACENKPKLVTKDSNPDKKITDANAMRGKCKSGRFWKSERDRFRSVIKSKGLKPSLKMKMKLKEDRERIRAYEKSLSDAVKKEKEELRARQEENKKRREENARKSEVLQQVCELAMNLAWSTRIFL